MTDWNDLFTIETDWTHVDFVNMFISAYNERVTEPYRYPLVEVGDDIQTVGLWEGLQYFVEHICPSFIDPLTVNIDGQADYSSVQFFTWESLKTKLGWAGDGWTRKYIHEFNMGMGNYLDATDFAEGDKSRCMDDGKTYLRSGGTWVPINEEPTLIVTTGKLQRGDYIGPWIFNELRDAFNQLLWSFIGSPFGASVDSAAGSSDTMFTPSNTLADAEAQADARWPSVGGSSYGAFATYTSIMHGSYPFGDVYQAQKWASQIGTTVNPLTDCEVDFYVKSIALGTETNITYDDFGLGLTEDEYVLLRTVTCPIGVDTKIATYQVFPMAASDLTWPTDGGYGSWTRGYNVDGTCAVLRYDFDYTE